MWWSPWDDNGWDDASIAAWLREDYPTVWSQMRAGWRYPDGELLPLPFQPTCDDCGALLHHDGFWCDSCLDGIYRSLRGMTA